jgi:hypothetical protein
MVPRGSPDSLDAGTSQRILRTFLVVRIVRGGLLLLFLTTAVVAVELRGWPHAVAIAIAVAILVQAGALAAWCRRYAATGKGTPEGFAR